MALEPGRACYIPLGHKGEAAGDLFEAEALIPGQPTQTDVLAALKPMLEDRSVLKIAQNMKFDWLVLRQRGIDIAPIDDTMLISYVLDAGKNGHGMDELAQTHLRHKTIQFGDVAGRGKSFVGFARVPIDKATEYSAEDRRRDAAAMARAETPARGRAHERRLRDAGAADDGDARAHGAARRRDRPRDAGQTFRRVRANHGAAGGGDL